MERDGKLPQRLTRILPGWARSVEVVMPDANTPVVPARKPDLFVGHYTSAYTRELRQKHSFWPTPCLPRGLSGMQMGERINGRFVPTSMPLIINGECWPSGVAL